MALTKGKHQIAEIAGVNCSTVETGLSEERMNFLKDLLEFNGYAVQTETEKSKEGSSLGTFVIGITDLLFNPMIAVYQKKLLRKDGKVVSPAYWNQWPDQWEIPYWQIKR